MKTSAGCHINEIDRSGVVGLNADVWPSDGLSVEVQLSEDRPGRIGIFFQRHGFSEDEMTPSELDLALAVLVQLKDEARKRWPKLMQERRDDE